MGRTQAGKAETRERILAIAARRLRENGLDGIGVADLMKEAGLTVGGFYKHFASRDDLVAEAVKHEAGRWRAGTLDLATIMDVYLSDAHCGDPGSGCLFAALAADLGRHRGPARRLATDQLRANIEVLAGLIGDAADRDVRARAMTIYAAMAGAVSFARMVDDPDLSRAILDGVRETLEPLSMRQATS